MNILFLHEWCGWFGGVEQNIADTVAGLTERGHSVSLAWRDRSPRRPDEFAGLFGKSWRCSDLGASSEGVPGVSFEKILAEAKPDVVYLHKVPSIAFLKPWHGSLRMVRMVHDHDLCCPRRHKYYLATGMVCRRRFDWGCIFDGAFIEPAPETAWRIRPVDIAGRFREMRRNRHLAALLVGSRFMREELLINGFGADRVHILPPVVKMAVPPDPPPPGERNILYVGQLIRGKGVDLLLKALTMVRQPWTLSVVGEGNARPGLESLAGQLGLSGRVTFRGWIPREELGGEYAAARLSVVPSRWPEPFGMVGLEAMLHARPVVGFAVGGIPDWLEDGETGFAVPEQDLGAMAGAIDRLLADRRLAGGMGAKGRARALERFSYDAYLDRLLGFLSGTTF